MDAGVVNASRQPELIALCTIMISLATVAVLLRCWSMWSTPAQGFGYDDLFAILALPFIIAETAIIYWWVTLGLGLHASTIPLPHLLQGPKIIFAAAFLYDASIALPKFSALFLYHRIFLRTNRAFSLALRLVGAANAAWLVSAWLSTVFQCVPVEKAWDPTVRGGHCFPQWGWFLGTALSSTLVDLCILVMPLPMLWGIQASVGRKAFVTGVFLCGYCVIIVSVGRLVTLAKAGADLQEDPTWSTVTYIEWVQCEGPVSLVSVCLPRIFTLGRRIYEHGWVGFLGRGERTEAATGARSANDKFLKMDTYPHSMAAERTGEPGHANWHGKPSTDSMRFALV